MSLQQLKSVIQAAVPSIMELKFGCAYAWGKGKTVQVYDRQYKADYYDCRCRTNSLSGQAFSRYRCKNCKDEFMHPNTGIPIYCRPCAEKLEKCQFCGAYMKILGRPIRLSDALIAIHKINPYSYFVDIKGELWEWDYSDEPPCDLNVSWDLANDSLEDQSSEFHQFLINLLCK